jgi:hypothetical protein
LTPTGRLEKRTLNVSLDKHGGKCEHSRRDRQSKRLRGLEVDRKIELGRDKHRQFSRLFSLENAPRVDAGFTIGVVLVRPLAHQSSGDDEITV